MTPKDPAPATPAHLWEWQPIQALYWCPACRAYAESSDASHLPPAPAPAGEAATTDESEGPWGTAQTDVARRALAAAPVSPPPATDPVLRARLARALSSLASMRAWHSLYHGRDPCALCVDADGCLTREGVAVPEDWRPDVYYRLAGTEMEILPPPPRQDRGGTGGAE